MTPPPGTDDQRGGARSSAQGTPVPVDLSEDVRNRPIWVVFLAGPVVWFTHFMLVYLVAEAGCTGDGPGLTAFDPPVPVLVTLVATGVAVALCAAATWWAWRWWRLSQEILAGPDADERGDLDDDRRRGSLAWAGLLLSAFSVLAVLFTGAPALVLGPC